MSHLFKNGHQDLLKQSIDQKSTTTKTFNLFYRDYVYILNQPLKGGLIYAIEQKNGRVYLSNPFLEIDAYGSSYDEAEERFLEFFEFLYATYALEKNNKLSEASQELKEKLLEYAPSRRKLDKPFKKESQKLFVITDNPKFLETKDYEEQTDRPIEQEQALEDTFGFSYSQFLCALDVFKAMKLFFDTENLTEKHWERMRKTMASLNKEN